MVDARTTPRWLQQWVLAALFLLALYFAAAWPVARAQLGTVVLPGWAERLAPLTWPARWRMFTELRPWHGDVSVVASIGGADTEVDLASIYPSHWNEGPGYTRDDFLRDPDCVAAVSADLCARLGADSVRWTEIQWGKTLGSPEQPRRAVKSRSLWQVGCDGSAPRPLTRSRERTDRRARQGAELR